MSFVHHLTVEREVGAAAEAIGRSLSLDVEDLQDQRSRTAVRVDDGTVRLEIDAADLVALRAAANTWLSLLDVAERARAVAEGP